MKKNSMSRRKFFSLAFSALGLTILSKIFSLKRLNAKTKPKVLILGMGVGGATCLNYIYKLNELIEIIVVEKKKLIRTGAFSNLVIGNILDESKITFGMNHNKYKNVKFIYEGVQYIDYQKKYVKTSNDLIISFDYLIISPGIGFKENIIEGYSPSKQKFLPHCWDGESKITRFKSKLNELRKNPTIIISAPDYPYRCPPAPYERASLLANYFKKKGQKPKIIILDSKDSFTKKDNFLYEWKLNYGDLIEWIPRNLGGKVVFYDYQNSLVKNYEGEIFKGDLIHIIPDQMAARVILESNIIDNGKDWCEVNPISFEVLGKKDVYALGDSIDAGDMPKSAFSANNQAKVLTINLINKILERDYIEPVFLNTCYSFSREDRAFSITAWYRLNSLKNRIVSLGSIESDTLSTKNFRKIEAEQAYGWYETLISQLYK